MRKTLRKLTILLTLICAAVVLLPLRQAFGQGATATPRPTANQVATAAPAITAAPPTVVSGNLLAQNLTLASLNVRNVELVSPQGSTQFLFRVPDNWQPDGASSLNLNIQYFLTGTTDTPITSVLRVLLDNVPISTITLQASTTGPQTITVPLDNSVLTNANRRTHTVQVSLDARDQCVANQEVRILIRSDQSFFHFEYREAQPLRDLGSYPRPFFNNGFANQLETALVVLPTNYTNNDLEAAGSIVTGLGFLTSNSLVVHTTTADQVSDQVQQNNNLILIGQIGSNPLIDALYTANALPTRLGSGGALSVRDTPVADSDGVLQLVANPKNAARSILTVTGKTPEGLQKAARALGGQPPSVGFGGALALISEIREPGNPTANDMQTFASLGYGDVTISGIGTRTTEIRFPAPSGTILSNDAYVDLDYDYAATLKTAQTTLTLSMNETLLESVTLGSIGNDPTNASQPTGVRHLRASIPPQSVRPGEINALTIVLDVQGNWKCYPPSATVTWLSARSTSRLFLPRQNIDARFLPQQVSNFPSPFSGTRTLQDTLIALPDKPTPTELDEAFRLISRLGAETPNGVALHPRITLGKLPEGIDISAYHLIVYGRPSTNSLLAQINENLPQPFAAGSDDLKQILNSVTYRLPPGYAIGVLQTLKSPWSPNRSVLVVTGTDVEGQSKAMGVLTSGNYTRADLRGNVVYAASNTISVVDTNNVDDSTNLPTEAARLVTESAQIGTSTPTNSSAQTVTPGPTGTNTPTRTPGAASVTPLVTATYAPTISTPLPTFAPLAASDIAPEVTKQPIWVTGLAVVTGVVIVIVVLFGLVSLIRSRRKE